jgi:hypothetical protein
VEDGELRLQQKGRVHEVNFRQVQGMARVQGRPLGEGCALVTSRASPEVCGECDQPVPSVLALPKSFRCDACERRGGWPWSTCARVREGKLVGMVAEIPEVVEFRHETLALVPQRHHLSLAHPSGGRYAKASKGMGTLSCRVSSRNSSMLGFVQVRPHYFSAFSPIRRDG